MGHHSNLHRLLLAGKYAGNHISEFSLYLGNGHLDLGHVCKKLLQSGELLYVMPSEAILVGMVQLQKEQMA
jgi:hypothetical protein